MRQYEMCEITVHGKTEENSWAMSAPEAVFACGDSIHKVKGFAAGEGTYKIRFLPEKAGIWNYKITGVVQGEGTVEVEPAPEESHGKVSAEDCHFVYQDGTYYYPFGTTVYALVHQTEELYEETMHTLENAPFNKVRMCVFPKHYDFNHNEPRYYAFEKNEEGNWDVNRPCYAYWEMLEEAILRLNSMGIQCDLILFHPYDRWGFSKFTEEEDLIYLDYAIRRLSAMPNVWWSMANEYDLVRTKTQEHWEDIEEYLAENDPYRHLTGNHNCFRFWDHTRKNITHASLQTKVLPRVAYWRTIYKKPVCIDECCYEGNIMHTWGSISGREMTYRFWRTVARGGYCTHGETFYSDDEVLWWAKGGKLKGESPKRIAYLKEIVDALPGPIEPVCGGVEEMLFQTPEELEKRAAMMPPRYAPVVRTIGSVDKADLQALVESELVYSGRVGEEAYITFYDLRTCVKSEMQLPEDKKYKLELIDIWNMTRETLKEGVSGKVEFEMPGKEGYAVLATRESE